ncbi:MAG: hypothetical protein M1812_007172 [Candelaria pacifica]|nr:MAG: hypothetical protein M1812_007172 [Candelaria pacifica]
METEEIILSDLHQPLEEEQNASAVDALPPADGGRRAWLFLLGGFIVEGLVWGFPFSYGVFQQYYSTHEPFSSSRSSIAVIGTLASVRLIGFLVPNDNAKTYQGVMYFLSPFVMGGLERIPQYRRLSSIVGTIIIITALVASSFASTVWHLILTQGVLYAIGGALLYSPTVMYLDEWFFRRKGLALGIMFAGTGVGGVILPLIMNWGLQKYGLQTTLRFWAVTLAILLTPLLYYVRPRLPMSLYRTPHGVNLHFTRTSSFWFMQIGNILQGIGYFVPSIFLPTYAYAMGLPSITGPVSIALLNAASIIGQVCLGALSDRYHVTTVLLISAIGSSIAVFLFWGLSSTSTALLYIFALAYGSFAGGFSSCWAGMIREIRKKAPRAETGLVLGLLAAGRGVGCVICGPVSEALIKDNAWMHVGVTSAYGSKYGPLIVFTGVTAVFGGVSWVGKRLRLF